MAGKNGGKRPGAGRKPGPQVPQFRDFVSQKDIDAWMEILRDQVVQDNKLLMWALDHYYGKAPQPVQGELGGILKITFDDSFISPSESNK